MATVLTGKGQVTIPKNIRDALALVPGSVVDFAVNREGDIVIRKIATIGGGMPNRFDRARGKANVK